MATIYFTNNADSGDGSLRKVATDASAGDVIMPDPTTFQGVDTITILLASQMSPLNGRTIDGGDKRIVLNGQGYRFASTSSALVFTYKNVTFTNFSRSDYGPGYFSGASEMTFENCIFTGNSGSNSGFLYFNSGSGANVVTLKNCLSYDNSPNRICTNQSTSGTVAIIGCTLQSGYSGNATYNVTDSIVNSSTTDMTEQGFVSYSEEADHDPWDFRLLPTSSNLTGASLTGTDILGHPRKTNGAKGCYEGSWIVLNDYSPSLTLLANTVVDYMEINASTETITINTGNYYLTVTKDFSSNITSVSGSGYMAVPTAWKPTDSNLRVGQYGATVTAVTATVSGRTVYPVYTKTNNVPITCIEYTIEGANSWTYLSSLTDSVESFTIGYDKSFKIRTFDGESFVESTFIPRKYWYKGSSSQGSFAEKTDWAMDAAKTLTCNIAPSIANCYFYID